MNSTGNKAIDFYLERDKIPVLKTIYDFHFGFLFYRRITVIEIMVWHESFI